MICPLLSVRVLNEKCYGNDCAWWDSIRKCCAVIPVSFGQVIKKTAEARLDSDVELSGGPV